ncbi:MAG: exodeoxyribonuclease III [Gammaproteobacteria bacterium]|nr:exodeoxyribonuclease III [Gammaproteobacteria bacterium]
MRIITINLNGIRSAAKKGFFAWLSKQNADLVCMQETKAQCFQLQDPIFSPEGYTAFFSDAERKGYSGTAIYTRHKPCAVKTGLGWPTADLEGRYVEVDLGALKVASLYVPSGTSGEIRQNEKFDFMRRYLPILKQIRDSGEAYIICGDWNIAHKTIDLENWQGNQHTSGFLPEERAWLDTLFGEVELVDAFRVVDQSPKQYTWWSHRGRAREKNIGWRIDYHVITPGLKDKVKSASIYTAEQFSDHAPLTIEYEGLGIRGKG